MKVPQDICKCTIDGFKIKENLDNVKNAILNDDKNLNRSIDESINIMKTTEIDCGIDLTISKTNIQHIKSFTDSGRMVMALDKLDSMLNPVNEDSILRQLGRC
jgi:hypothetical protein